MSKRMGNPPIEAGYMTKPFSISISPYLFLTDRYENPFVFVLLRTVSSNKNNNVDSVKSWGAGVMNVVFG